MQGVSATRRNVFNARPFQAAFIQQKIKEETMQVEVVDRHQQIEICQHEIQRKICELDAQIKRPGVNVIKLFTAVIYII